MDNIHDLNPKLGDLVKATANNDVEKCLKITRKDPIVGKMFLIQNEVIRKIYEDNPKNEKERVKPTKES